MGLGPKVIKLFSCSTQLSGISYKDSLWWGWGGPMVILLSSLDKINILGNFAHITYTVARILLAQMTMGHFPFKCMHILKF